MRELTIGEICSACGGTLLSGDPETRVSYFSLDSRDVPEGTFFVPVIGEKVDAHRFLGDVQRRARRVLLPRREILSPGRPEAGRWL